MADSKFAVFSRESTWKAAQIDMKSQTKLKTATDMSNNFTASAGSVINLTKNPNSPLTRVPVRAFVTFDDNEPQAGAADEREQIACSMVDVSYNSSNIPTASFKPAIGFTLKNIANDKSMKVNGYMEGTPVSIYLYYNQADISLVRRKNKTTSHVYPLFKGYICGISGSKDTTGTVSAGMTVQCIHRAWCIASLPPVSRVFSAGWSTTTMSMLESSKSPLPGTTDATGAAAYVSTASDLLINGGNLFDGFKKYLKAVIEAEALTGGGGVRTAVDAQAAHYLENKVKVSPNMTFNTGLDGSSTFRRAAAQSMMNTVSTSWKEQTAFDMMRAHVDGLYARMCWTADGLRIASDTSFLKKYELNIDSSYIFSISKTQAVNPRKVAGVAVVCNYVSYDATVDGKNAAGVAAGPKLVMWPPLPKPPGANSGSEDYSDSSHSFTAHAAATKAAISTNLSAIFGKTSGYSGPVGTGLYLMVNPPAWATSVFSSQAPEVATGMLSFTREVENADALKAGSAFETSKPGSAKTEPLASDMIQRLQNCIAMLEFGHRVWRGTTMTLSTPFIPDIAIGQRVRINCGDASRGAVSDVSLFGGTILHGCVDSVNVHVEPGAFYMDIGLDMVRTDADNNIHGFPTHPIFNKTNPSSETTPIFDTLT